METVEIKFQYTQAECVKAERTYLIAAKIIHKYDLVLAALFFIFALVYLFISSFSRISIVLLVLVLIVAALGAYLYCFSPILRFKQSTKYQEAYTLTFTKEEIKWKTPSVDSALKWSIYTAFWESSDFYFLIQAPRIYTLIPKRAFRDDAEKQAFEELVLPALNCHKRVI